MVSDAVGWEVFFSFIHFIFYCIFYFNFVHAQYDFGHIFMIRKFL